MIKIGDFAHLSQVSIATLRHYDDMGLLKPVAVDKATGYRYYSVAQLPRLNRILALKDLGFSLEQIDQVLNGLTLEQLRGMLKMKHAEVERQLAHEQERLARITARLRQIELEDTMSDYDVVLKTVAPMFIASRSVTIPSNDQVPDYIEPAFKEAGNYIKDQGAKEAGPCFAIWHQPADVYTNEVAEVAIPVDRLLPTTDRVKVYELPQTQVAAVVHHGSFDAFQQIHAVLLQWVEANDYRIVGPYREIYIQGGDNSNDATAEIQYPVEKG